MNDEPLISTFTALRKGFLRLASKFLPDEDDANDALQDAFCRLWPRRHLIHSEQEAEALTVTTLRNLCIDRLRKEKFVTVTIDDERDAPFDESAADRMEKEELFREVETIIEQTLTPLQRTILHRREYDGASMEDIAVELGMQQAAVRMQLSRARKTIRECYQKRQSNGKG